VQFVLRVSADVSSVDKPWAVANHVCRGQST
jgi:hypothetical protein